MATTTEAPSSAAPAAPEAAPNRRPLFVLLFLVVAVGGAFTARSVMTADQQNTDDAQIDADVIPLAARVAGLVTSVKVVENQAVKKGDLVIIPAGLPHRFSSLDGPIEYVIYRFEAAQPK